MSLVEPVAIRLILVLAALAPILWATRVLSLSRVPPLRISRDSLDALRRVGDRRRNPRLREIVDDILEEVRRLRAAAETGETGGTAANAPERLTRIEGRLRELVERAREAASAAPSSVAGESDFPGAGER